MLSVSCSRGQLKEHSLCSLIILFLLIQNTFFCIVGQPSLTEFSLNLTSPEQLLLTFNEAVTEDCNSSLLFLVDTNSQPPNFAISLMGVCMYIAPSIQTALLVNVNPPVWTEVQAQTNLATVTGNTFLSLDTGFVSSISTGLQNMPMTLGVTQFTANLNPPILFGCIIDRPSRLLGMQFSEGVIISSLVPTGVTVTFLNSATNMMQTYTLTGGSAMAFGQGTSMVGIELTNTDFGFLSIGSTNPSDYSVAFAENSATDANGMSNNMQTNVPVVNIVTGAQQPPEINSFTLDLGGMVLEATFSVSSQNFVFDELFLTNQSAPFIESNSYSLAGSSVLGMIDLVTVQILLTTTTVDAILADSTTCTDTPNCFLFWRNSTFTDLNGGPTVEPVQAIQAQGVTLQIDTTPPELTEFSIDLLNGGLSLTFSEPVFADVFVVTALTLTDGVNRQQGVSGTVDLSMIPMDGLSTAVTIMLSEVTLNFAKALQTPRLAVFSNATTDAGGNSLIEITTSNPLSPTTIVADTTPPMLLNFTPDPGNRQLIMMFDESVDPSSWNENMLSLTLQVLSGDFTYSNFTGGTVSSGPPENLTYTISTSMFVPPFRDFFAEATSMGAIVLAAQSGLVSDLSGNSLNVFVQLIFTVLPPDVTPPTLTNFFLDMNLGTLEMTFSEPVYLSPPAGLIQFYNQSNFSSSDFTAYTLAENGTYLGLGNGPTSIVTLTLGLVDLNAIKADRFLCTSLDDTYIGPFPMLAQDRGGNNLQPISSGIPASGYVGDTTPPNASSFQFNLDSGLVSILFSEPVDRTSANFSGMLLIPSMNSQFGVSLSGNTNVQYFDFDTVIAITLDEMTLNSIKSNEQLCTQTSNCYMSLSQTSFRDTNSILPSAMMTVPATELNPDTTTPALMSYNIDLNNGALVLTFSEPVNENSFNPASFNFTSLPSSVVFMSSPILDATLRGTSGFNTILTVQLGTTSLNQVKSIAASNSLNFGASVDVSFITDTSDNRIAAIPSTSPLTPQTVIPDTRQPQLVQFRPQFPTAMDITLYFDELVLSSTLQENVFTMSLTTLQGTFVYTGFSGGTVASSAEGDVIIYTFSASDFNSTLSAQFTEASQRGSVSLTVTSSFIMDVFNNSLFAISSGNPLVFSTDTQRPILLNYTLDLDMGLLDLFFSEPVNINPIPALVQILNSPVSPTANLSLTGFSSIVPSDTASASKIIYLTTDDILAIIANQMLATSPANTFLVLQGDFVSDLSGNVISPNATAISASVVILDTTAPFISVSQLDLNQGSLILEFSEPILSSTLDPSRIFITGMMQSTSTGYNLAGSTFTGTNLVSSVTLQLSNTTLNTIKSDLQVCSSNEDCFVFVSSGAFEDASGNVSPTSSRNITRLFEDVVQPTLNSFSLDLNAGTMVLSFSEPIRSDSFNPNQISLLSTGRSQSLERVTIVGFQAFNSVIRLSLDSSLLNQVKFLSSLGSIVLSMTSSAATDTSNLMVEAIPPVSALSPSPFVQDTTPPTVLSFIPSSGGQLTFNFVFDEFVNATSLRSSMLSFQLRGRNGQFGYADLSSATITDLSDQIVLTFPPSETRFSLSNTSFQDAYLSSYSDGSITFNVVPSFITDISGNGYNGVLSFTFTNSSDNERPRLTSYTLDLNTGELTLTFSEDVNILRVVGNAMFGNSPNSPSSVYNIMQEPSISTVNSLSVSSVAFALLNMSDVDNIVASPSIGTSVSNTYLYLLEQFAVDASGNYLNVSGNAVQASQVTQRVVVIQPQLTSFDFFSLENGSMVLSFNVPVDVNSLVITELVLYSEQTIGSLSVLNYSITGGSADYANENQTSLRISLNMSDIREIKTLTGLATDRNNTFVSISGSAIQDTQGAAVIASVVPLQLSYGGFVPDTTGPTLLQYTFDLRMAQIVLTFSDIIMASTFNSEQITVQNARSSPTQKLLLTSSVNISQDSEVVQVQMSSSDLNVILSLLNLSTSASNTFISFTSELAQDIDGNYVFAVPQSDAVPPQLYVPDNILPSLETFTLDMNSGLILLSFSEPILTSSFRQSGLVLQNAQLPTSNFSLTNESIVQSQATDVSSLISIMLSEDSLNILKSMDGFSSRNDSFILVTPSFATDTSGNMFTQTVIQSSAYLPDMRRPTLIDFDLNLQQNNALHLYFSEAITYTASAATSIALQNSPSNATIRRPLTNVNTINTLSSLVGVEVRINDQNIIVDLLSSSSAIATSTMDLYITLSINGFTDFAMNDVFAIPEESAKRVRYICKLVFVSQIIYTLLLD